MLTHRHATRRLIALATLLPLLLSSLLPSLAAAQATQEGGHAQVIAQGVGLMPRVPVAWRLTSSEAQPADDAEFFERTLGFAIGADDPILITSDSGVSTLLNDGQALFHPEGAVERRSSTRDADSAYVNIELIVADAVESDESLGSSTLVHASDDFTAPDGTRNLQLTRDTLAAAESASFTPVTDAPSYVYVTRGALQVTDAEGKISEINAGSALAIAGTFDLLAGTSGEASFFIASIGDEVEVPPVLTTTSTADTTGTLEMHLEICNDGLDDPCEPATAADITVPAFHLRSDENWIIPDRAKESDNGSTLTWTDLAVGTYTTGEVEHDTPMDIEGARWNDSDVGWRFRISEGKTTELTLKVGAADDRGETGSLLVTLYDCPAGVDPASEPEACDLATETWDVLVENPGQTTTDTWSLQTDALDLGDSQYWFELLPAETLVFWPDATRQDGLEGYAVGGSPTWEDSYWAVDIPYHGAAEAQVYRLAADNADPEPTAEPTAEAPVGSGLLVISQIDCPFGTDISVDTSTCTTSTDPWEVTVTNDATGQTWSLLSDGVAYDTGTYVLEGLPVGTYSIYVAADETWSVSYSSSVEISDANESYVDVYSVDLQEP
jgi:hypothetical protein